MRRSLLTLIFLFVFAIGAFSQSQIKLTQYFQSPQLYNPAFTGVDAFLDFKFGRKQNFGAYEYAPKTTYFSINAPINASSANRLKLYSLRISNPNLYDQYNGSSIKILKHGLGASYVNENQDNFTQQRFQLSYALHLALGEKLRFSMAASPYFFSNRVNADDIKFEVNPDPVYSQYSNIAYTRFGLNLGGLFYSDGFYFGYSALDVYKSAITVSEDLGSDPTLVKEKISHRIMTGFRLRMSSDFDLMPGLMVTYAANAPLIYNINTKLRFREQYWAGLSYQTGGTISLLAGGTVNNWLRVGYSYDHTIKGISNFVSGSHELVVGIMLFKNRFSEPHLW